MKESQSNRGQRLDGRWRCCHATLPLLSKYKRKVEWLERDTLLPLNANEERELAKHLYADLFVIGICDYAKSASKRGAMEVHTASQDNLVRSAEAAAPEVLR
jgi:hypothetical protein